MIARGDTADYGNWQTDDEEGANEDEAGGEESDQKDVDSDRGETERL